MLVPYTQSEFWTASDLLPPRVPARAALAPFRCSTKHKPALAPGTAHFPWRQQPSSWWGAPPQSKRGQSGPHYGSRYMVGWSWETGQSPGQSQSAYSALFGEQGNMYVNFTSGVQVSHSAPQPRQFCWSSSQQQDSSSWYGTQSLAYPICGWNHLLPRKYLQACVVSPFCVPSQGCRS